MYDFKLSDSFKKVLRKMTPNFGYNGFGEIVYYRTYSRVMDDGRQESWADTVIRVVEGTIGIRKHHMMKNHLPWDEQWYQNYAYGFATSLFRLEWSPPGRGLWSMGTRLIAERGAMPLYNCAFTQISENWIDDICWIMDLLMNGVGVGFEAVRDRIELPEIISRYGPKYTVGDSREGWVASVRYLLNCIQDGDPLPRFDYSYIREAGEPLVTFGGTASGPGPLIELHKKIIWACELYINGDVDVVRFKTDIANLVGCCVVAGNIRRSAEIALGHFDDPTFLDLKNYKLHPDRVEFGWMSNNSAIFERTPDFDNLNEVAYRIVQGDDLGVMNKKNFRYGRIGDKNYIRDRAIGLNPCAEIPLENKEVCNLAITCPTRCEDSEAWIHACEYACFYASTVSLLPTHCEETNAVVARNHRIGVDILDFVGWTDQIGTNQAIKYLRRAYKHIRNVNTRMAREAGVAPSLRLTTIKPNGTVSKLMGRSPNHPNARYMLRRIRIQRGTQLDQILQEANIPFEPCVNQPDYTHVFEYPVYNGSLREVSEVSLWEQAMNVVLLQREWADNAVSNTLYFAEHEVDDVEHVLSSIVPVTKSVSMMRQVPCHGGEDAPYPQMPEQRITAREFQERLEAIEKIDWSRFRGDGIDQRFCDSSGCEV